MMHYEFFYHWFAVFSEWFVMERDADKCVIWHVISYVIALSLIWGLIDVFAVAESVMILIFLIVASVVSFIYTILVFHVFKYYI